jgi:predicted phosphoadenosine phosphosulfate sulfurtransferase
MFKYENLDKPTNKTWKKVAIFLARTLPIYIGIVSASPLPVEVKLWSGFIMSVIAATISGLSEFTTNEEVQ